MRGSFVSLALAIGVLGAVPPAVASPIVTTIDFQGLADGQPVGTLQGATFSNATAHENFITNNAFEFPDATLGSAPGGVVAANTGVPMTILLDTAAFDFSVRVTYQAPVAVSFFDPNDVLLGTASSAFSDNRAFSGAPGSAPNELLSLSLATASIQRVVLTGRIGAPSFKIDDVRFTQPIPEPTAIFAFAVGLGVVGWRLRAGRPR